VIVVLHREVELLARALKPGAGAEMTEAVRLFENQSSLISSSLALQNLLLMADHLDLGSCCMTGPLIADEELFDVLGMPEGWKITAFVTVGWPDEDPQPSPRKKRELIAKWVK
jgi:nitroreductase